MKLNKQRPSFTIFLNYIIEQMKIKSFLPYQKKTWNLHELDENMQFK